MKVHHITHKISPVFSVLSNRHFRRLWIGQITSQLASNMLIFLLALVLYRLTGSNVIVSGLFLSYGLPSLLFGIMAGAIVDRLDRKTVLVISHAVRGLLIAVIAASSDRIPVIYLLVFLYAVMNQLTMPAEVPLIPQFVPKQQLVTANSFFTFTFYGSLAIGLMSAGPALRVFGRDGVYAILFVLYMAAAFSVSGLPKQGAGLRSLGVVFRYDTLYIFKRLLANMADGIHYVATNKILRESVVLLTGTQIMIVLLGTLGPGFADTVLHIDVRDASVLVVGPVVAGILGGSIWAANKGFRYTPNALVRVGILAAGLILMTISAFFAAANAGIFSGIAHAWTIVVSFGLFFLLGVANSLLDVPSNTLLQREAGGEIRGRVYGILSASVGGAGILPIVVSAILADIIGVGTVIAMLGICIFSYGVIRFLRERTSYTVQ